MTNRAEVYNLLKDGKERTSKEIQKALNMDDSTIRNHIRDLVENDLISIVSSRSGYKVSNDVDDLRTYWQDLYIRKKGLEKRMKAICDIIDRENKIELLQDDGVDSLCNGNGKERRK